MTGLELLFERVGDLGRRDASRRSVGAGCGGMVAGEAGQVSPLREGDVGIGGDRSPGGFPVRWAGSARQP